MLREWPVCCEPAEFDGLFSVALGLFIALQRVVPNHKNKANNRERGEQPKHN